MTKSNRCGGGVRRNHLGVLALKKSAATEKNADLRKGPWTSDEDRVLRGYVKKYGCRDWNSVQNITGLPRCGKSCRFRYMNYLDPNLKKGPFTPEEEQQIISLHLLYGNQWSRMAQEIPGRTDNQIKNFWNTRTKRLKRAGLSVYPQQVLTIQNYNDFDTINSIDSTAATIAATCLLEDSSLMSQEPHYTTNSTTYEMENVQKYTNSTTYEMEMESCLLEDSSLMSQEPHYTTNSTAYEMENVQKYTNSTTYEMEMESCLLEDSSLMSQEPHYTTNSTTYEMENVQKYTNSTTYEMEMESVQKYTNSTTYEMENEPQYTNSTTYKMENELYTTQALQGTLPSSVEFPAAVELFDSNDFLESNFDWELIQGMEPNHLMMNMEGLTLDADVSYFSL